MKESLANLHKKVPGSLPTDPRVKRLFRELNIVGGKIRGSDEAKRGMRREIYSMVPYYGPPTIFLTLNPSDVQSPIIMHFAGAKVRIGAKDADAAWMPIYKDRVQLIARDPVASAKFFNATINAFLKFMIGYDPNIHLLPLEQRYGVLGDICAYYGVTEAQNRGTLHFHGVFWMRGAPHPDEFMRKLKSRDGEKFRADVLKWFNSIISEYVPGGPLTDFGVRRFAKEKLPPLTEKDLVDEPVNSIKFSQSTNLNFQGDLSKTTTVELSETGDEPQPPHDPPVDFRPLDPSNEVCLLFAMVLM